MLANHRQVGAGPGLSQQNKTQSTKRLTHLVWQLRLYSSQLSSSPLEISVFSKYDGGALDTFAAFYQNEVLLTVVTVIKTHTSLHRRFQKQLWGTVNFLLPSLARRTLKPRPHGVSIKTTPSSPVSWTLDLQYRLWPHSPRLITLALQPRGALFSRLTTNGEETCWDFSFFFCCKILSVLSSNKSYSKLIHFRHWHY